MASKGIVARVGLIAAVAVIVAVSTLSPLLKQPAPANDTGALVAFAPPLPEASFVPPATLEHAAEPAPSANSPVTTDASTRPAALPEAASAKPASPSPAAVPAPAVTAMQLPSGESPEASPQPAVETPPAPPIVAASEPPKVEKRARAKRSAAQSRRVARPPATPFSYNQQLAAH